MRRLTAPILTCRCEPDHGFWSTPVAIPAAVAAGSCSGRPLLAAVRSVARSLGRVSGVVTAVLSPRLIPLHLLALVATSAAVWLGVWQYDAWQERRAAEARDLVHATPVPLDTVLGPDAPFPADAVGQPVTVAGRWVPEGSFLVSGRELGGRRGFWAVTPLAVCATDGACPHAPALLVVRGWAASAATVPAPPN